MKSSEWDDLLRSADNGDAESCYTVGIAYLGYVDDIEIELDVDRGLNYLIKSAEGGKINAAHLLGFLYREDMNDDDMGVSIPKDDNKAIYWFKKSLELGDPDNKLYGIIGHLYYSNDFEAESFPYLKESYEKYGDRKYLIWLATLYLEGEVSPKDERKAFELFNYAIEDNERYRDIADVANFMGDCYAMWDDIRDYNLALDYYCRAASSQMGYYSVLCLKKAGVLISNGVTRQDRSKCVDFFKNAIELGDTASYSLLAAYYEKSGQDIIAANTYLEGFNKGVSGAGCKAARLYEKFGQIDTAYKVYLQAAEAGDVDAQNELRNFKKGLFGVKRIR